MGGGVTGEGGGQSVRLGGQGGWERRSKVFVKIKQTKKNLRGGERVGVGGGWLGGWIGPTRGWGGGGGGSKVWGRWVRWGM